MSQVTIASPLGPVRTQHDPELGENVVAVTGLRVDTNGAVTLRPQGGADDSSDPALLILDADGGVRVVRRAS